MSSKYPNLVQMEKNSGIIHKASNLSYSQIISLLKRARKNYITCKANSSQETGLWGQECIYLRKLLDGKREKANLNKVRKASDFFTESAKAQQDIQTGYII